MKLTVCIICKNEENAIEQCLSSVAWADEVVVLDSGSVDSTIEVARKYTDRIFVREDWAGFGEQRRRAEELASNDWIFAIDCDEVVTDALKEEILSALQSCTVDSVLILNRITRFCDKFIKHSGWHPDPVARVYNRKHTGYNQNLVHESVVINKSNCIRLREKLLHFQYEDIYAYINKRNKYANMSAGQMIERGKRSSLLKAVVSSTFAFIHHYVLRLGFLDGKAGFVIAVIQSQYSFNKYMFAVYRK